VKIHVSPSLLITAITCEAYLIMLSLR